ncbi:uncharacterized protein LOC132549366 [Ylistrum balloti]|uniref:uncharacterized protein LOC132549366 n=1 Tax=Ylistrum balloti TaxID=509963 RepID=UPI002905EE06|nr:uncharacterized protein LOC132549366 [Ylistrum balloti]
MLVLREELPTLDKSLYQKALRQIRKKTEKLRYLPTPANPEELCQFLGFVGYYREFVKDFSKIARPLTDLFPLTKVKKNKGKTKTEIVLSGLGHRSILQHSTT